MHADHLAGLEQNSSGSNPVSSALFRWDEEKGIGYYPVDPGDWPYDKEYFEKYVGYANTELGARINEFRVSLVARYATKRARVLDFGIGCGSFLEAWMANGGRQVWGFDINPEAHHWLHQRGLWRNPFMDRSIPDPDVVTCWDSLEHVPEPEALIACVPHMFACSLPIFDSADHVLSSKHFRPTEHYWYFTERGLIGWMERQAFHLVGQRRCESELGREDIGSYVFIRNSHRAR